MKLPEMLLLSPTGLPVLLLLLLRTRSGAAPRGSRRATVGGMSSRRPAVLLLALSLLAALVACGDDDPEATGSSTTTAPGSETTASTAGETTTSAAPATTDGPTTAPPTTGAGPGVSCDEGTPITADADGDGTDDTITLVSDPTEYTSELRVCTATGGSTLDALGASSLEVADVDGDGAVELFYGGSAATSKTVQVARMVDGALVGVTVDGGPLLLVDGFPDGTPPDGPRHAYGCPGELAGTPVDLVALQVTPINAAEHTFQLQAIGFVLDGATATVAESQDVSSAEATPGGTPEELIAYAEELVAANAPAC